MVQALCYKLGQNGNYLEKLVGKSPWLTLCNLRVGDFFVPRTCSNVQLVKIIKMHLMGGDLYTIE